MIDLNRFVPRGSHLTVTDGETINDRGEIAASGMPANGDFHANATLAAVVSSGASKMTSTSYSPNG